MQLVLQQLDVIRVANERIADRIGIFDYKIQIGQVFVRKRRYIQVRIGEVKALIILYAEPFFFCRRNRQIGALFRKLRDDSRNLAVIDEDGISFFQRGEDDGNTAGKDRIPFYVCRIVADVVFGEKNVSPFINLSVSPVKRTCEIRILGPAKSI